MRVHSWTTETYELHDILRGRNRRRQDKKSLQWLNTNSLELISDQMTSSYAARRFSLPAK